MPFFLALIPIAVEVVGAVQILVGVSAVAVTTAAAARTTARAVEVVSEWNQTSTSTTTYVEKKTVFDWWCNGLTGEERQILLEHGYNDNSGCFSLEELKRTSERMYAEKAPGKPTEKDGFKPDKKQGDKLVKNPNGQGKGYLDENGEVWVPTGENAHGGPHWDVQNPRTGGHRNVYPGGRVRY